MESTKECQSFTDVGTLTARILEFSQTPTRAHHRVGAEQIGILGYWDTRDTPGQDEARLRGIGPATAESVQWTYLGNSPVREQSMDVQAILLFYVLAP